MSDQNIAERDIVEQNIVKYSQSVASPKTNE